MDTMHPVMREALQPFTHHLPPPGFQSAPVMEAVGQLQAQIDALKAKLDEFNPPRCSSSYTRFTMKRESGAVYVCDLDYYEPDYCAESGDMVTPEFYEVIHVYCGGKEVTDDLSESVIDEISEAALKARKDGLA